MDSIVHAIIYFLGSFFLRKIPKYRIQKKSIIGRRLYHIFSYFQLLSQITRFRCLPILNTLLINVNIGFGNCKRALAVLRIMFRDSFPVYTKAMAIYSVQFFVIFIGLIFLTNSPRVTATHKARVWFAIIVL